MAVDDLAVEPPAPVLEEAPVGYLVGEGVLESVLEVREEARLVQELGGLEAARPRRAARPRAARPSPGAAQRHVLPDHRRRLQERLVPGGSRSMRAASTACTVAGTWMAGSGRASRYAPRSPDERPGLDEGPHALLQEERVAFRPRDQHASQRLEAGVGPEQRAEELLGALRREGVQPELRVVGPASPAMRVLRPVVHEEEQPGRRQALDEPVEQRLGLGVDPVEVLEDHQERLHLALAEQEPLDRVERPLAALRGSSAVPRRVSARHVEQGQEAPAGWPPGRGPASGASPSPSRAPPAGRPGPRSRSSP